MSPVQRALVLLVLLQSVLCWAASGLRAQLDRQRIDIDETVTLTIEQHGDEQPPQLDGIGRDFIVVATSSGSRVRIVDGEVTRSRTWQLQLAPKRAGTLEIPSLRAGRLATRPLRVDVLRGGASLPSEPVKGSSRAVRIETAVTPANRYVQAQLTFTQRLVYAASAQLYGDLPGAPVIPGAIVIPLGAPAPDSREEGGQLYGVVEQRFAIFPQRSGTLTVPPARVEASVDSPAGRRRAVVSSPPLNIAILAVPATYPSNVPWLPAQRIAIDEQLDVPVTVEVGAPIVRTVRTRSEGLSVSTLPELPWRDSDRLRTYIDAPRIEESTDGSFITGTRTDRVTFVPTEPGTLVLPGLTLTWFDVTTETVRVARLPEHRLAVQPSTGAGSGAATTAESRAELPQSAHRRNMALPWLPGVDGRALLVAVLVCSTLALIAVAVLRGALPAWRARRDDPARRREQLRHAHASAVLHASANTDPRAAFRAYTEWRALSPAQQREHPVERALRTAALQGSEWNAVEFQRWFATQGGARTATSVRTTTTTEGLPPLYPGSASDFSTTS